MRKSAMSTTRPVIETDDHGGIRNQNRIVAGFGGNFQAAFDRRHLLGPVRQFSCNRLGIDAFRIRYGDRNVNEHIVGGLAQHPEEAEAGMADRIRDRAFGGLGGIPAMDVNAHAHFGDTAYTRHRPYALVGERTSPLVISAGRAKSTVGAAARRSHSAVTGAAAAV